MKNMILHDQREKLVDVVSGTTYVDGNLVTADFSNLITRPNGRYAIAVGAILKVALTITETTVAAPVGVTVAQFWNIIQYLTLKFGDHTMFNTYSGLSLIHQMNAMDEICRLGVLPKHVPVAAIATAAGDTALDYNIIVPFARDWFRSPGKDLGGAIPLSELKEHGEMMFKLFDDPISGAAADHWDLSGNITAGIDLITVETEAFPTVEYVRNEEVKTSGDAYTLPGVKGTKRASTGLLVRDDASAALTMPTSFSLTLDDVIVKNGQSGADHVKYENIWRSDGINDIGPAVCPLVTTVRGGLRDCPTYTQEAVLNLVGAQHSGDHRIMSRQMYQPTKTQQREIMQRAGVPMDKIASFELERDNDRDQSAARNYDDMPLSVVQPSAIHGAKVL